MSRILNKTIITTILFALMPVALAFAASGGGTEEHGSIWVAFGYQVLNFGILVTILLVFTRKPIRDFFKGRSESIAKSIDEATKAREAAEAALAEVEAKFATKDEEIKKMQDASEASGKRERQKLIDEGERLSKRIIEQAKSGIGLELKQASEALQAEVAQYAVELAHKKLASELSQEQQKQLFEEALNKLEDQS